MRATVCPCGPDPGGPSGFPGGGIAGVAFLTLVALLVSLLYAAPALYGLYLQEFSGDAYRFVPARYGYGPLTDDYFYYARIRDMVDGLFFSFDPITFEHRHTMTAHATYHFSFFMMSFFGMFFDDTASVYTANMVVLPALNFVVVYLLIRRFSDRTVASAALAVTTILLGIFWDPGKAASAVSALLSGYGSGLAGMLDFTAVGRGPNILFTNIQLVVFALLLHRILVEGARGPVTLAAFAVVLAAAAATSFSNFLICWSILAACLAVHPEAWTPIRPLAWTLAAAAVLSLPGALAALHGLVLPAGHKDLLEYGTFSGAANSMPGVVAWDFLGRTAALFAAGAAAVALSAAQGRRFLAGILGGAFLVYLVVSLSRGTFFGTLTLLRGSEVLVAAAVAAALASGSAARGGAADGSRVRPAWSASALGGLALVAFLAVSVSNEHNRFVLHDFYGQLDAPEFAELAAWSRRNAGTADVAVTLDFDLLTNLPAHGPLRQYIPQVIQSPAPAAERLRRFFEAARFHGLDERDMEALLAGMRSHIGQPRPPAGDPAWQPRFMQLALFYGKYAYSPMPEEDRRALVDAYRAMAAEGGASFSFKADYLIVSTDSRGHVKPGSAAAAALAGPAVFANGRYAVHRLSAWPPAQPVPAHESAQRSGRWAAWLLLSVASAVLAAGFPAGRRRAAPF